MYHVWGMFVTAVENTTCASWHLDLDPALIHVLREVQYESSFSTCCPIKQVMEM
jgi:hypothetical protein